MDVPVDLYRARAQLAPAFLVLLPLVASVLAWFPSVGNVLEVVLGVAIAAGGTFFLAQIGRDAGRRKETRLFASWGGKPTTAMLRHSDGTLDAVTKARYHTVLGILVPRIDMPDSASEVDAPKAADEVYDSAVQWLLARTRSTERYRLVFQENVNYGFRRNLWGLKGMGILVSVLAALGNLAVLLYVEPVGDALIAAVTATAIAGALLLAWVFLVRNAWVRTAAFAYARALLQSCDSLECATEMSD